MGLDSRPCWAALANSSGVDGHAGPPPAQDVGGPDDDREADLVDHGEGLVEGVGDGRGRHAEADLDHGLLELVAVLGGGDGLGVGPDELDAVLVEDPGLDEGHGQVQGRLAAEGGRQGVGLLPLDDAGQDLEVEGLDVGGIGEVGVGHDRGRVRVGQDDPVALLPQDPAGLGARVVELAGLADDDRPGADEQDRRDVVALGHQCCVHQVGEEVEQVAGVVGPGPGLGVVLHAEGGHVVAAQALDDAVVEVHVGDLGGAQRVGGDGVVVVLAGDLDAAGGQALDRVVAAVVAEGQLLGRAAEGGGQQLVAEADAEDRDLAEQAPDGLGRGGHRRGVAGAVGQEDAVGLAGQHLVGRGPGGHDLDGGQAAEVAQDRGLHAEVVGHDPAGAVADGVGLGAADDGGQVLAVGAGLVEGGLLEGGLVGRAEGAGHGPGVADVAGQAPGVDPGDAGHTVAGQEGVEVVLGPPVAAAPGQLADDHAAAEGPGALVVVGRDPVVADVGIGEGDHLPGVGGVGDDLLVAGQDRVEHDLAGGHAARRARPRWPRPRRSSRRPGRAAPRRIIAGPPCR